MAPPSPPPHTHTCHAVPLTPPPQYLARNFYPSQEVVLLSISPHVVMVDGFLDEGTCRAIRELAGPRLVRSRVAAGEEGPVPGGRAMQAGGGGRRHVQGDQGVGGAPPRQEPSGGG